MGSLVSPIVVKLCMEVIEELAISTSSVPPKICQRCVDDSFVIIKRDVVSSFHDTLNTSDPIELENNGQIAFLDTLVSRRNGVTVIDVYRKPTHRERYLNFSSHHEIKHKISTASNLLFRAFSLASSHGKTREPNYVRAMLEGNGYPSARNLQSWDNLQISNVMLFIKSHANTSLERHRRNRKLLPPNWKKVTSTKFEELCSGQKALQFVALFWPLQKRFSAFACCSLQTLPQSSWLTSYS